MVRSRARLRFKLLEPIAQGEREHFDGEFRSEKRFSHEVIAATER